MKGQTILLLFSLLFSLSAGQTCQIQDNTDYNNGYLVMLYQVPSAQACCSACASFQECTHFSYEKLQSSGQWYQRCFVKGSGAGQTSNTAITSGVVRAQPPAPACAEIYENTDFDNGWLSLLENVPDAATCCQACSSYHGCNYWSYMNNPANGSWNLRCFLKATNSNRKVSNTTVAGRAVPSTGPSMRSGKRGLAWFNSASCSDLRLMKSVSWIYNWAPLPDAWEPACLKELGISFVPMQWGLGGLTPDLNFTIWGNAEYLLTFNEPNFQTQSNVSPQQAIAAWPTIEKIAGPRKIKISSPAAAACGPLSQCYAGSWSPVPWFDDFFKGCVGCKIDFLATHIYTCNFTEFTTFLGSLKKYNLPIWLTEFACPASGQPESVEIAFMKQAIAFLEADPTIEKYAWFGTRIDPTDGWLGPQVDLLDDSSCALTDLGKLYNSL